MERLAGERTGQRDVSIKRVALASGIGTAIEWYDFFLYGTAAALIFGQLFFPNFSPLAGTLAAFGTFAVGFVSRPIGGIVCGHFGDKIGRKAMLILTLMVMGVATFLIGLLPTYESIGVWAPILLVTLRFLQGFGMGGELGGAQLMCVEYAPENKRGFYGAWPQMGSPVGQVAATGLLALMGLVLSPEQFLAWGWRIPFLLSIVIVAVGMFIRLQIMETPAFRRVQETRTEARLPIVDVVRTYPKKLLLATGMYLGITITFYIYTVFTLSYVTTQLGVARSTALNLVIVANVIAFFIMAGGAALSDRVGRRPVYVGGSLFIAAMAFPFFLLVNTGEPILILSGLVLLSLGLYPIAGTQGAFFAELFGTRVRYSGVSLSVTVATLVGGAVTPSLATLLVAWSGGSTFGVSAFLVVTGLIAALSALLAGETFRDSIYETAAEEPAINPSTGRTVG